MEMSLCRKGSKEASKTRRDQPVTSTGWLLLSWPVAVTHSWLAFCGPASTDLPRPGVSKALMLIATQRRKFAREGNRYTEKGGKSPSLRDG